MSGVRNTRAGREAEDPDRLMQGENPDTRQSDDIEHWFKVYTELVQTKAELLAALSGRLAELQEPESRREVADTDLEILKRELGRLQRRLDFWRGRCAAIESKASDPPAPAWNGKCWGFAPNGYRFGRAMKQSQRR